MKELEPSPVLLCANCSAPLQGAFCHDCGQSIKSVLQPVSHMLEDAGDIFFHLDERIVHTLPPLFTKPGYLTLEYFSGRRVRYIAPFRLMFVFCLLAFFLLHLAIGDTKFGSSDGKPAPADSVDAFASAKTADEVHTLYNDQIREVHDAQDDPVMPAAAKPGLGAAAGVIRQTANARLAQLNAAPLPVQAGEALRPTKSSGEQEVEGWFGSRSRVDFAWLPGAVNRRIDTALAHFKANLIPLLNGGEQRQEAAHRIIEGFFSVLPQAMFVMVPVFALILKLFYAFRRRLYMEHVIVALHSHAFLFFSLLALTLLGFAKEAIRPHLAIAGSAIGLVQFALWVWMPLYLLIMQKRVYRQGWGMTILKYWLIGSVYFWLLLFVVGTALLIGMSH
jgi:hypothetical protein